MAARAETVLAASAGLVAVGVVGIAVLAFGMPLSDDPVVTTLWWVAYLGYLAVFVLDPDLTRLRPPWSPRVGVLILVLAGLAVWFLAPQLGWSAVLFVVTAGSAGFLVTPAVLAAIVIVQTTAVLVGGVVAGSSAADVAFTGMAYLAFQAFAAIAVLSQRRQIEARAELAAAHTELRATSALLETSSRSAERLRIARDLHDVLGHQLTALALELEVAGHHAEGPAGEHVTRARAVTKDLLGDVRGAVGELRDTPEELGTVLRRVVTGLPGLVVHLDVNLATKVDEPAHTALVRCLQEVVTNTLRHASASRLDVSVTGGGGEVVLRAVDDGIGTARVDPGNGLTGMSERFTALGGSLELESARNRGFTVVARVPLS